MIIFVRHLARASIGRTARGRNRPSPVNSVADGVERFAAA